MQPLKGLRVLEWGGFIAAPYATHLLRQLGAEVWKVEPPSGDPARHYGPFPDDIPDPEASGLFIAINAGKQSVRLDTGTPDGLSTLRQLAGHVDVLVTDLPLAHRRALGLDAQALAERHPALVTVGLSTFGETGPLAEAPQEAMDACAVSGVSHVLGERGREPLILPFHQPYFQAGVHGAAGALMALLARQSSGQGQNVDIASADVLAFATGTNGLTFLHYGSLRWEREGRRASGSGGAYPYTILPCKDGLVCLMSRARVEWERFIEAMGHPAWADDPRFRDLKAMGGSYPDEVDALLAPWLERHTRAELSEIAARHNFPLGPLKTIAEMMASAQLEHRRFFQQVPHATLGRVTVPGVAWQVAGEDGAPALPAPRLGEHTASVPGRLQDGPHAFMPASELASAPRAIKRQGTDDRPLAGLRVLDMGWVWSGPMVATVLAEFGAEVIKVEHRERLDNVRLRGVPDIDGETPAGPAIEINPYFNQINHGKDSITVNLKDPRGQALLHRLIPTTDVVLENLTPGALARQGFGYEQLSALNPALVMLSMSSTGQHGPMNNFRAYAPIMSSLCGLENLVGYPDDEPVGMLNFGYGDPTAAAHALPPLLSALLERRETGRGRHIDMSQTEAVISVLVEPVLHWTMNRTLLRPGGSRHPAMAPHGIFPAAGTDRWLSIAVRDDAGWRALVALMDEPAWARAPAWSTRAGRLADRARIDAAVAQWTRLQPREELVTRLREAGVPASPVLSLREQQSDVQSLARGVRVPVSHPYLGERLVYRTPWTLSRTPPVLERGAPVLGQDNDRVFARLGLRQAEIDALKNDDVIA